MDYPGAPRAAYRDQVRGVGGLDPASQLLAPPAYRSPSSVVLPSVPFPGVARRGARPGTAGRRRLDDSRETGYAARKKHEQVEWRARTPRPGGLSAMAT